MQRESNNGDSRVFNGAPPDSLIAAIHELRQHPRSRWLDLVRTDKKRRARASIMRHLIHVLAPPRIAREVPAPDPKVLFPFEPAALTDGRMER